MTRFLLICLGGAIGSGTRYLLSGWVMAGTSSSFPFGTLTVNILGSFLIGIVMHLGLTTDLLSPTIRIVLVTGFLGGFTTYSSFNYETLQYFQSDEPLKAISNAGIMLLSCLTSGWLGLVLAGKIVGKSF